jgi:hypothetical protein
MFQNPAIDIAVGLILMYLVLSLLCTVINEFIATKLRLRSKNLAAGLQELLDDPVVRNAFYDHGLIAGTKKALATSAKALTQPVPTATTVRQRASGLDYRGSSVVAPARAPSPVAAAAPWCRLPRRSGRGESNPAFIHPASAGTFAHAGGRAHRHAPGTGPAGAGICRRAAIEALPPSKIKGALQASLLSAQGDFNAFHKSVTTWFDDSMDRLSGSYKRHLKLISIVIGCAVAVIMNADTFATGYALWSDSALRAQIVDTAGTTVKSGASGAAAAQALTDVAHAYKKADETVRPLPIGWPIRDWPGAVWTAAGVWFLVAKLAGWFVTGLALSLGAPFWFDVLSKFVTIRGAGVKPDRQDAKG